MKDKVVLVTGAAGRLGGSLCRSLLATNHVIAAYHEQVPDIPSQLLWPAFPTSTSDNRAWCVQANLSEGRDVSRLVEISLAKYGRIDVVINTAADLRYHGRLTDLHYDVTQPINQLTINTIAPFTLVSTIFHETWKHEREDNAIYNRNVINLSSFSGSYVEEAKGQAFYGASKAALNLLTLHLALELAPYAVRANALCPTSFPGLIPTTKVVAALTEVSDGIQTGQIFQVGSDILEKRGNVRPDSMQVP